ncbi:PREDICTED: BPI fold-containing family A member 2 [Hipposideros armiger]|uniref:BPI fold-containing family A member 2 n=1 Tax=Hipposideros armiger TaxID=186990 RepID=A0A8B7RK21_HIPAR|nr:PREDICTED: BPI fold-containing family A member 2 [Hipposideros armiger]
MFQLWKLVLLCGLLTGTSGSLLGNLGNDLNNVVSNLKPVLDKGLETIDNTLDVILGKLNVDLAVLQESKVWQLAKHKIQEAEKIVTDALSNVLSSHYKSLGLKISNVHIVDVRAELASDGKGLNLRLPITADVTLTLPLVRQIVNLKLSLDLLAGLGIEVDDQTGVSKVVLGECSSDSNSVSIALKGSHAALTTKVVDSVTSFLSKTVSFLVEKQMCPLVRIFVSTLDVEFVQNVIEKLQQGLTPEIAI